MKFNLNEFLRATANALDTIEIEIFGLPTNHSKRIALMSTKIVQALALSEEKIFDISSLALLHDNGASIKILHDSLRGNTRQKLNIMESRKEHCILGEQNLVNFPFLTQPKNIIKYHHEKYDGSGFFGLSGENIPLFSQIIGLADTLDLTFNLNVSKRNEVLEFVRLNANKLFSKTLCDIVIEIASDESFWVELYDENIDQSLEKYIPVFNKEFDLVHIREITKTFSKIIDAKSKYTQEHSSGLSDRIYKMAKYFRIDEATTLKLMIATDLHDMGKLGISNDIIEKPGKLTEEEYNIVKKHPETARDCLKVIEGFEDITKWVGNHHERLDGSGYPAGLTADELDFNTRLISSLDVYQALREERPYRKAMNHQEAMSIINEMVQQGKIDAYITRGINTVFQNT